MKQLRDFRHIAIVQTAFIGDIALVLPLVQAVRTLHPAARITLVTTPAGASLASCAPAADAVIAYDKRKSHRGWDGIRALARELRSAGVDCVLAPHRSLRTTLLTALVRPRLSVGFDRNALSLLYTVRVPYLSHLHEVERNLSLLSPFADVPQPMPTPVPDIAVPAAATAGVEALLAEAGIDAFRPLVVLAPGSIWPTKRWPAESMTVVAQALVGKGWNVVLSGSNDDRELCEQIAQTSGAVSLAGKTGLPETLALLQQADVLLCNDSAPTHLANLVHCPVLAIFGPTSPVFGFAPRNANDKVLELEHLACRPCAIHGQQRCPLGTLACMNGISAEHVVQEVAAVVQQLRV